MVRDEPPARLHSVRGLLSSIPAAFAASCVVATLVTDVAYWATANMQWANFSAWLITVGVIIGWLSVLLGLIEIIASRAARLRLSWFGAIGWLVALILATLNAFVHTRDAWTSVVPWGLVLSAAAVIVLFVTGFMMRAAREPYDAPEPYDARELYDERDDARAAEVPS
jgi:uncharacterized membrane protein